MARSVNRATPKTNWRRRILSFLFIGCAIVLAASATYLILWKMDNDSINAQNQEILNLASLREVDDSDATDILDQDTPADNPYWDYIKMKLIDVNFSELKAKNSQTVGWIQVGGTNINYPFVQTDNNEYYLTHSFDKSRNAAGWVFMDYRNNIDGNDRNTIIYAHSRLDQTMFGSLKNILTNGWLNDTNNYVVKMSTEDKNTLWQVFSVYHVPVTSDYLQVKFASNDQFTNFLNTIKDRSAHNFNTPVDAQDQILTLSTCYGTTDRVVLHAKLIKVEDR